MLATLESMVSGDADAPTDAGTPGVDVYDGCVIDYKGTDVTPETFTKVLTGDDSAGGKVLKSGADDRVFVNFVDHGAVGLIGFPRTTMHAKELIKALTTHELPALSACSAVQRGFDCGSIALMRTDAAESWSK